MNLEKYTQKSQEALLSAQRLTEERRFAMPGLGQPWFGSL